VVVIASKTSGNMYGVDLSILYAVDHDVADVITYSYGACEQELSPIENTFYANFWAQAAAQGTSALVASGDSGAAGCEGATQTPGLSAAVNGLGSSPYCTSVGGTLVDDGSAYWDASNDATTKRSALSYAPEVAWNESRINTGGTGLYGSG